MNDHDVIIIGAGITGSALFYVLSRYTNIKSICLLEKYSSPAQVNSATNNNSQTLHFGDIETNYSAEKAKRVNEAAKMVQRYIEDAPDHSIFMKGPKMALAVGSSECKQLAERFREIKPIFPRIRLLAREEIAVIEPNVVWGRDPAIPLCALYSEDGYVIDFGRLANSFIENASGKKHPVHFNAEIQTIKRKNGRYVLRSKNRQIWTARCVVVASGSHSLIFAKKLGYGKEYGILPVAGSFYCAHNKLNGKVYTMQIQKLPFAAVHGDPTITNPSETRFGPTAKVLPLLERHNYKTMFDFLQTSVFTIDGVLSLLKIISDPIIFKFVARNITYDLPFIGKYIYAQQIRKIIPTIKGKDIRLGKRIGGIRPQVVNTKTKKLELDEAKIIGDNIIFDITPSPGASMCLKNAENNTRQIMKFLGNDYLFDEKKFQSELGED